MIDKLSNLIKNIKENKIFFSLDEAAIKQTVVLQLLSILGWDTYNINEVRPEYSLSGKRVDYSLCIENKNKIFIEVKKPEEDLENHEGQLLNYAYEVGSIELALLTNGVTWWFYLPRLDVNWKQRKFYTIDIFQQQTNEIVSKFIDLLFKENIINGVAKQNAENIYRSYKKQNILRETLPKAWNIILTDPDEIFIELLRETTENICGYRPEIEGVEKFIVENKDRLLISTIPSGKIVPRVGPKEIISKSYTGKSIIAFSFINKQYKVHTWKDLLIQLVNVLYKLHSADFNKVLNLKGRKRPYFSYIEKDLRAPKKISNTNIFVETNLSANNIVRICRDLLKIFGYSKDALRIEAK